MLLERFIICPYAVSRHIVWGTLHLGTMQKLIHQGYLLREGGRQFYYLSGQMLFAMWDERTWMVGFSMGGKSVVDPRHEI
ncbi:hypothetical protein ACFX1S_040797 [Malus domestica]